MNTPPCIKTGASSCGRPSFDDATDHAIERARQLGRRQRLIPQTGTYGQVRATYWLIRDAEARHA